MWIYDDDRAGARSFSAAGTMTAGGDDTTASGGATSGAGGVITLPKGPTGALTLPRGVTGVWTIVRKAPAPPPAAPLIWTTKGGAR